MVAPLEGLVGCPRTTCHFHANLATKTSFATAMDSVSSTRRGNPVSLTSQFVQNLAHPFFRSHRHVVWISAFLWNKASGYLFHVYPPSDTWIKILSSGCLAFCTPQKNSHRHNRLYRFERGACSGNQLHHLPLLKCLPSWASPHQISQFWLLMCASL